MFDLKAPYLPTGDQPKAIQEIIENFNSKAKKITLLGATGTGKTFTMANVIKALNKPTLVISHNKTLAAQLATEFKYFFPNNAVHYFVSYFDYYQPEDYIPSKDIYIEKESTINKEIEMFRLSTMASLLTRKDVIVVSSVSALYGLGTKEEFEKNILKFEIGNDYDFKEIKKSLINMQYKPAQSKIESGTFDFRGEMLDIFSSIEGVIYRLIFNEKTLELIQAKDATTFKQIGTPSKVIIWPATQFLQNMDSLAQILSEIENDLKVRVKELKELGKHLEAERLQKRTMYDIRMIKETGFTNGIENYSRYFDRRKPGEPPSTIFDYFPDDMFLIIDESHMALPQLKAMYHGDRSRKIALIEHGFRLPSAIDHRPLMFEEIEHLLGWGNINKEISQTIKNKIKSKAKTLFVSATPGAYELENSDFVSQQIIRPTGLLDPISYVYPKSGDYNVLLDSVDNLIRKKPYLDKYLSSYETDFKDIFNEDL